MRCNYEKGVSQMVPLSHAGKQTNSSRLLLHNPLLVLLCCCCLMISPLLLRIWFRGWIFCGCKVESSDLKHFGEIITWSSSFKTSEICFHLAPVIFFSLPFTSFPKSIIFSLVSYLCGGISYSLKTCLEGSRGFWSILTPHWSCMRWKRLKDTAVLLWTLACFACLLGCWLLFRPGAPPPHTHPPSEIRDYFKLK